MRLFGRCLWYRMGIVAVAEKESILVLYELYGMYERHTSSRGSVHWPRSPVGGGSILPDSALRCYRRLTWRPVIGC